MVKESRSKGFVSRDFNNMLVVLIPKKEKAKSFEEFHPTSLCNKIDKIITKVAANKLKIVLDKSISAKQSGFTPNRSIVEEIIIAHEAIHSIKAGKLKKIFVKLDIEKAYNRVDKNILQFIFHERSMNGLKV